MRDYRENQFCRNWWDEKLTWASGMTRNDLALILVGVAIIVLYLKFPIHWDFVLGLRP